MTVDAVPDIEVGRYALRSFRIDYKRRELRALTQGLHGPSEWRDGMCVALCRVTNRHPAPNEYCHCGVYGTLTLGELQHFARFYARELVTVIAAEGATIIGDRGLRTAYARVVAYWAPASGVRKLCAEQCKGATNFRNLDDMLAAYGLERGRSRLGRRSFLRYSPRRFQTFAVAWCAVATAWDAVEAAVYAWMQNWGLAGENAALSLVMGVFTVLNYRIRKNT